jgi:DMSO/TMAO reductase YedYZ molybdopterin-dependent catalytic subunit
MVSFLTRQLKVPKVGILGAFVVGNFRRRSIVGIIMPDQDPTARDETQFPGLKDDSAPDVAMPPPAPTPPASEPPRIAHVSFADRIAEREPEPLVVPRRRLTAQTRRDFLVYGAGVVAAAAGFWAVLPPETQQRLGAKNPQSGARKERFLNKALDFDDAVATALYSPHRLVPTYDRDRALPVLPADQPSGFPVNYEGGMPDELYGNYVPRWKMTLSGLAGGGSKTLTMRDISALLAHYGGHEQVTRLVCVEGWSAIGWWSGLRFADFLQAFPPMPGARWAELRSDYNVQAATDENGSTITDAQGNTVRASDPYYVSVDLGTARHPQALLATEQNGRPLTIGHGAPLRLLVPMKLGLKNIKAITSIVYTVDEPKDYWSSEGRGYSHYDGL